MPVVVEPAPAAPLDDPYTVPLALASSAHERTISFFDDEEDEGDGSTRLYDEDRTPPRASLAERSRRALLLAALGLGAATAVAAYPWLALVLIALLTWLFRGASLAATAAGARRTLRGARWYDGPQLLLASPWHVVQAIPGALLLLLWSLGLGLAAGLICYALVAGEQITLLVSGATTVLALWLGPGGSRFRGPVTRMVNPLCRGFGTWVVLWAVLLGAAIGLGILAQERGTQWQPLGDPVSRFG